MDISNKLISCWGKITTAKNNASDTYTLPAIYTTTNYICASNAILKNHWANMIAQTTSTITIHVADYGYSVASGFNYCCIGY